MNNALKTFLWFDTDLEAVLDHYTDVLGAEVRSSFRDETGRLFTADVSIYGHPLILMSAPGGPAFNDSISLSLNVDGQSEVDRIWDALTAEGKPGKCGWCVDKFGVSWQVSPIQMRIWLEHSDPTVRAYAWPALMEMTKIIIDDLHE
jgi:predicted 3-demethylubiquinone-9 3-methyltransferase (glyoxalase superfamily)